MAFNQMSMNNNYVDARTPEERANEPESVITYASAMNKDTLKEMSAKKIYDIMPYDGLGEKPKWVENGNSLIQDEARKCADEIIQQAKEEEKNRIVKMIDRTFDIGERKWCIKCGINLIKDISNTK